MPNGVIVPKRLISIDSTCFRLKVTPPALHFHTTATEMSLMLWLRELKWRATGRSRLWRTSAKCSLNLVSKVRDVSPMYTIEQDLQVMAYTRLDI